MNHSLICERVHDMRLLAAAALLASISLSALAATADEPTGWGTHKYAPDCAKNDPVVWADPLTKNYHLKDTQLYGHTSGGKYACQSAAVNAGYKLEGGAGNGNQAAGANPNSSPASQSDH